MRRSNWLAGLVVGAAGGVLFWLFPILGIAVMGLFAILAVTRPDRLSGVSGLLVGAGAGWLGVLSRAIVDCNRFNEGPNQGCVAPDLTAWIAVGAMLFGTGMVLLVVAVRRRS